MQEGPRWEGSCNSPCGFLTVAHDILYFETNDSLRELLDGNLRKKLKRILILVKVKFQLSLAIF
jgi:hypothetical protein